MPESVLIVGTGALACLFAARLAALGVEVTMLGTWREGLLALMQWGVTLVQTDGHQTSYKVKATDNPADCAGARYALVLVKAWQTESAAERLAQCLADDGLALTLQNGLGNYETLAAALGPERVALGTTTTGATLLSSGRVRPGGEGVVSVGAHERLGPLAGLLKQAGFNVETLADVQTLIWGKLVINAAINPVTALLRTANGEILTRESAWGLSAQLAREVAAVAAAKGIELAFDDPAAAAEKVAERTAGNHSSMYQDIQRGAPTEIDAICGAVVAAGREAGVPTPANEVVWQLVKALREGQRGTEV
ncbi:MAG: 2-dehydropantoate 2-reductase [Anaerolineae bacterium]|nr:MAG: 2-dehydropantoate 2-reductase [Anaerolineae bacterium]